ncbi:MULTISPECIES: HAD family hydrolase [unclassified Saccharicrinis]|uniref:HAD family hydrolase n=1 Tax=unclassified Saccharicrinis TaxID=2646859 RepID=UPI003D3292C4
MTNLESKKNIIFDLGNVVVDIDLNITLERFRKLGFERGGDFIGKYKQSGIFHDFEVGKISADDFVNGIKAHMNPNVSDKDVISAWNAIIGDYKEERITTIIKLKETHNVFLLSNTNELHIEACANRVPIVGTLSNLFDKVYYSYELNMSKPNKDIFEEVLRDANIKAEETLFLDDGLANVQTAKSLGIESWLVEFPDQWVPNMKELISSQLSVSKKQ